MVSLFFTHAHSYLFFYPFFSLSFMRQIQDETLRLSTLFPLSPYAARYSNKDMMIEGRVIPATTPIIHALGVGLKNQTSWEDVDK